MDGYSRKGFANSNSRVANWDFREFWQWIFNIYRGFFSRFQENLVKTAKNSKFPSIFCSSVQSDLNSPRYGACCGVMQFSETLRMPFFTFTPQKTPKDTSVGFSAKFNHFLTGQWIHGFPIWRGCLQCSRRGLTELDRRHLRHWELIAFFSCWSDMR